MSLNPDIQALIKESDENFPVASWLLPAKARSPLLHFYAFARNADNIADSPDIPSSDKIHLLTECQNAIRAENKKAVPKWMYGYLDDISSGHINPEHGIYLLTAFIQDAEQARFATFDELLRYCEHSAVPVGRTVLELCEEENADLKAADALCSALQLINHLQDCGEDYRQLNRVYIPQELFQAFGTNESELAKDYTGIALRRVFREYLHQCRLLLAQAYPLLPTVKSRRLRLELALTLDMAWTLSQRLIHEDPLAKAVKIPKWKWPFFVIRNLGKL